MLRAVDYLLDRVTMYRLLLYYLIGLLLAAMGLSAVGKLGYNPLAIAFSAGWLVAISWATHEVFARIWRAPANFESTLITALILALIITPYHEKHDILFLTAAAGLAISSKYILAWRHKHIFNPAAIAIVLTAFGPQQTASWWVGSLPLLPFVVVGGLLLVRKIERGQLVFNFVVAALTSQALVSLIGHHAVGANLQRTLLHSSLWFLAFVMLTEPATIPNTGSRRNWYGLLVGVLFPPQINLLGVYTTPELALVAGNLYAWLVNPKSRPRLTLAEHVPVATGTMDFVFDLDRPLNYRPGQYMEFTLPHEAADSRGSRRYFTLASSPTESQLRIGVKFYPNGSTYKKALLKLDRRTLFGAGQLGGDFTLPADPDQKLALIAGGIGVTPFRSMLKYLADKNEARDVALIYSEKTAAGLAYKDVFAEARQRIGARIIYTLTDAASLPPDWGGESGYVSAEMIKKTLPDYQERLFYLSGPQLMVRDTEKMLHALGVQPHNIKTDFFPGYA